VVGWLVSWVVGWLVGSERSSLTRVVSAATLVCSSELQVHMRATVCVVRAKQRSVWQVVVN
jgi:hypothetical protein